VVSTDGAPLEAGVADADATAEVVGRQGGGGHELIDGAPGGGWVLADGAAETTSDATAVAFSGVCTGGSPSHPTNEARGPMAARAARVKIRFMVISDQ
jgi:hypothetical protein